MENGVCIRENTSLDLFRQNTCETNQLMFTTHTSVLIQAFTFCWNAVIIHNSDRHNSTWKIIIGFLFYWHIAIVLLFLSSLSFYVFLTKKNCSQAALPAELQLIWGVAVAQLVGAVTVIRIACWFNSWSELRVHGQNSHTPVVAQSSMWKFNIQQLCYTQKNKNRSLWPQQFFCRGDIHQFFDVQCL